MQIIIWSLLLTGISTLFIYIRFMGGINQLKRELKQTKRNHKELEEKYVRQTQELDVEMRARNRKMEILENKLQKLQDQSALPPTQAIAEESHIKNQQFSVFEQQTEQQIKDLQQKYETLLEEKQAEIEKLRIKN